MLRSSCPSPKSTFFLAPKTLRKEASLLIEAPTSPDSDKFVSARVCMHAHVYICIYIYISVYTHAYAQTCLHI